jgi:hypothetical protein
MAPIALMCPRFSATRMIATGAIRLMASIVKTGLVKFGSPNHAAVPTLVKSIGVPKPRPLAKIR